jgi:hypothetical protein
LPADDGLSPCLIAGGRDGVKHDFFAFPQEKSGKLAELQKLRQEKTFKINKIISGITYADDLTREA